MNSLKRLFTRSLFSKHAARVYQRGIARRYADQAERWAEHLHRSQLVVQEFVNRHHPRVLYILGSGWLLDLPMDFLLQNVPELHLLDIAHPRSICARYKKNPAVHFETIDVTGGLIDLLRSTPREGFQTQRFLDDIRTLTPPALYNQRSAAVISLNLLSQLAYPLLSEANAALLGDDLDKVCAVIQQQHLDWLREFKNTLLIFDFEEVRNMPRYISPELIPTVYTPFPPLSHKQEWIWLFDCNGSYIPNMTTHLRVAAGEL